MKPVSEFNSRSIRVVLTDIDGTLTQQGRLPESSYASLWQLSQSGLYVIPVTGRPAGWCEMIARLWPVHGTVGENGAFYFSLTQGKMKRVFARSQAQRVKDRVEMRKIREEILKSVSGSEVASDQFSRLFDLAIDFAEDVPPLAAKKIQQIVKIFEEFGATAKVSNIHVNGWFGQHNKLSMVKRYLQKEFGFTEEQMRRECIFVGDSPNDEPMFEFFPNAFAVANIKEFLPTLKHCPTYLAQASESAGFCEVANRLLALQIR